MMATYYPGGSEIQADHQAGNLQTLYLMNPNFSGYPSSSNNNNNNHSDTHNPNQNHNHAPPQHNMFFLNHSGSAQQPHAIDHPTASSFNHAPPTALNQQHQHLVGIPLASSHHHLQPSNIAAAAPPAPASSSSASGHNDDDDDPNRAAASIHEIPAAALHGLLHYNLWSAASPAVDMSQSSHSQYIPTAIAVTSGVDVASTSSSYMGLGGGGGGGFRRPPTPLMSFQQHQQQGGLSLSLNNSSPTTPKEKLISSATGTNVSGHNQNQQVADVMVSSTSGGGGVILGSKYLKAAQELLDEVVNVEKAMLTVKEDPGDPFNNNSTDDKAPNKSSAGPGPGPLLGESSGTGKTTAELSTAQRQELQMKKTKLLNMLDEVEQRYRQYHAQMQIVVNSFEQVAGEGAARSYTALALQTISKQFRCLKDAIASQIKATSRSLGDAADDNNNNVNNSIKGAAAAAAAGDHHSGGSRLRLVDHHLRQQRALQQLGMVQHNAWRPQRGLPERAVSVLRAWLFEHFLHPYPKDSDKHMLAKQTGLTRSQVSNWFINARVRLWKPMVEEMYLEEIKAQGHHHDHPPPPDQTQTQNNNNNIEDLQNTINNNNNNTAGPGPGADATTTTTSASTNNNNNLSNSTTVLHSPTSISTGLHHGGSIQAAGIFSFINNGSSSDQMDSILNIHRMTTSSPKRQRSSTDNNIPQNNSSPTSIISMEMEMKPLDHPNRELIFTSPTTTHPHPHPTGFGGPHAANYPNNNIANEMIGSRFDRMPDHNHLTVAHAAGQNHHHRYNLFQGNGGVSLTLGLPHCENQQHLSLSGSGTSPAGQVHPHHNFIIPATHNNNIQLGRTTLDNIDHHHDFSDAHQPSHSGGFTTTINDLHVHDHTRKRFAAHQLLPDFVT